MPELPDVTVYVERLNAYLSGVTLRDLEIRGPFVLRTVDPPPQVLVGRTIDHATRQGKRIVLHFGDELCLLMHLMIAGRLRWRARGRKPPGRLALAGLHTDLGTLWLTEAATKKRAALFVLKGAAALAEHDRGGLEVLDADCSAFTAALQRENRTLKRALTDPRLFSGIGNAYSDEILHAARLSPVKLTSRLTSEEQNRLWSATRTTLQAWIERLRREVGDGFPEEVTAFREGMAVHGRYRLPCPVCQRPVQRIRYADNECNYCAECQNAGKLLADRGLSQLMREDWPKTLDELEDRRRP